MAEYVSWKKVTKAESKYLGEWDIPIGEELVVTIADAVQEEVSIPARNITKQSLVITFAETPKKFVCNATNAKNIERATGSRILAEWVGKKIQLYVDSNVRMGNTTCAALRVRPKAPKEGKEVYVCSVCGTVVDKDLYKASVEKYGKAYCSKECFEKDTVGKEF